MHVILLRQFSQRLLASDGSQCHLGLERRAVVPAVACSSCLLLAASMAAVRAAIHLFPLFRFSESLLFERGIDICHETVRFW
jgi:hypothetical protein